MPLNAIRDQRIAYHATAEAVVYHAVQSTAYHVPVREHIISGSRPEMRFASGE